MRGRNNNNNNNNNNNRRGPNPLTRTYESNGPDVKIRGSAQQIAEKYTTLARDAQSSGDRVMAENYLQHAEHYNRIIAAAQAQMPIQNVQQQRNDLDDEIDEDGEEFSVQQNGNLGQQPQQQSPQPQVVDDGSGPQPVIEGTPAEVALNAEVAGNNDGEQEQPVVNGKDAHQASEAEGEAAPRRPRRPRRSRARPAGGEGAEAAGEQGEAEASPVAASDGPAMETVEN